MFPFPVASRPTTPSCSVPRCAGLRMRRVRRVRPQALRVPPQDCSAPMGSNRPCMGHANGGHAPA
eukprot:758101-Alexandrium_andersonii.AAC.1